MEQNKSYLIEENGDINEVTPIEPSKGFQLKELYAMLQCDMVEVVELQDGRLMVIDEESKLKNNPVINKKATELFQKGRMSASEYKEKMKAIYGNAFISIDSGDEEIDNSICGHALVCPPEMFR